MKLNFILLGSLVAPILGVPVRKDGSAINEELESKPKGLSWEQWHMKNEHQMEDYDPETFFALHDIGRKGYFDKQDILNMYGMNRDEIVGSGDGMGKHDDSEQIDKEVSEKMFKLVMRLLDIDDDDKIGKKEYLEFVAVPGNELPDLGVGVGHHSDFEHEYEVHHWNEFHKDKDPDVRVVHKEDIEHDLLHHEHEIEHEEQAQRGATKVTVLTDDELEARIKAENIPKMFKVGY